MAALQRVLNLIYPSQCVLCGEAVAGEGSLCGGCWREICFLTGHVCTHCGASLPGTGDGHADLCDDCIAMPRPWAEGRAAFSYRGAGRRFVLALKHSDRTDLAFPAAAWMAQAGRAFLTPGTILVPVPSHWTRRLSRRYNQAAEISRALAHRCSLENEPEALIRRRKTRLQEGMGVEERQNNVLDAIAPHPKYGTRLKGKRVCLIDDVMTSGATLNAATEACRRAGADEIFVLTLARVEKSS